MGKKYTEKHEWAEIKGENVVSIGISDFAQEQLGDIVYVDLPSVGSKVIAGEEVLAIESVKAASEVYSPVSGEVVEINEALEGGPELVNAKAESEGWLVKIQLSDKSEMDKLMDEDSYGVFVKGEK